MPKTLLLADDSVVIQKLVGLSFANEDVDLTTTDNGDDAIARARELKPDLVLADVVMPGKNGYEVCEAIKADPALQHIPVLLLTGTFEAFDENRARTAGSDGHITKPFEAQALVDRVTELLARAPQPAALASTAPNLDGPAVTRIRAATADEEAFEFFDEGVQDLDAEDVLMNEPKVAAPPPLPATPSPLADAAPSAAEPAALPPLGGRAEATPPPPRPDETIALIPDTPGGQTPPIDDLAFDMDDAASAPHEAATTIDLGDDADDQGTVPVTALDDLLLDESPAWGGDLDIDAGAGQADRGLEGDLFDEEPTPTPVATPAAPPARPAAPAATPFETDAAAPSSSSHIMSGGDSSSDSIAFGEASSPRADDGMKTMLADDLFGDAQAPPAPARPSQVGDPALDAVEDLMSEPAGASSVADEFDVSSSDLAHSIPAMPPLEQPEPAPATATAVDEAPVTAVAEPQPEAAIHEEPATEDESERFSVSEGLLAGSAAGTDGHAAQGAAASDGPDLTPMMRDRLHETLERVAWEALSDLSDTVVKQVVEKVESIAWEVIPQMAEAIIKEEIRRMKGEDEE